MELPKRKPTRLAGYDYSLDGAYFITICTDGKQNNLCRIDAGGTLLQPPSHILLS